MKVLLFIPLLLFLSIIHDWSISQRFKHLLPDIENQVSQNLDHEKRGGESLDQSIIFIDTDKEETPNIVEYTLIYAQKYLLKSGSPSKECEYHRNSF